MVQSREVIRPPGRSHRRQGWQAYAAQGHRGVAITRERTQTAQSDSDAYVGVVRAKVGDFRTLVIPQYRGAIIIALVRAIALTATHTVPSGCGIGSTSYVRHGRASWCVVCNARGEESLLRGQVREHGDGGWLRVGRRRWRKPCVDDG